MLASFFWIVAGAPGSPLAASGDARQHAPANALYLLTLPADYKEFDELVMGFKESGADTLIIRPVLDRGVVDRQALAKAVFFAHKAGLKLFVILPTRGMNFLLKEHPDWEDMRYDLQSGTIQPTGRLDLFNPYVVVYLSDFFRNIAEYSVDGILLDEDCYYSETEGMSAIALERYRQKYGSAFSASNAFGRVSGNSLGNHPPEEYGEAFWELAELKKNNLLLLMNNLIRSSRAKSKQVRFGIQLHVSGLFSKEKELLAWYSFDMTALRKLDLDFFWLPIPHRDIRVQQDLTYKQSIELVSRITQSSMSLLSTTQTILVGLQTASSPGKILPLSEIEEISGQVKKGGEAGIAFMLDPGTQLPSQLTKKIFNRQSQ
jgi:hypothetical protein